MKNLRFYLVLGLFLLSIYGVYRVAVESERRGYARAATAYLWQIDTLEAICNKIPDTITKRDTIYLERVYSDTVYVPVISETAGDTNFYSDTVKGPELEFIIKDKVKGSILNRSTEYTLQTPLIVDTVQIYKTVPHFIEKQIPVQKTAYLRAGYSLNYYSIGYGKIFNSKHAVGVDAVLYAGNPFVTVGYTYLIE